MEVVHFWQLKEEGYARFGLHRGLMQGVHIIILRGHRRKASTGNVDAHSGGIRIDDLGYFYPDASDDVLQDSHKVFYRDVYAYVDRLRDLIEYKGQEIKAFVNMIKFRYQVRVIEIDFPRLHTLRLIFWHPIKITNLALDDGYTGSILGLKALWRLGKRGLIMAIAAAVAGYLDLKRSARQKYDMSWVGEQQRDSFASLLRDNAFLSSLWVSLGQHVCLFNSASTKCFESKMQRSSTAGL
ncbi:hypothetical protein PHISP_00013 [Aspergillus sp. HF37]|nr:hypothetical protein PHISP_00013 [Aspergillus sp. HF37]